MNKPTLTQDQAVSLVRPEVRAAHEYVVGTAPNVSVKLNQNESPLDLPAAILEDLLEAVRLTHINRYPAEFPHDLRAALSRELDHPESGIVVGNGSNELTYTLGMTFIGPNTPVVVPRPMFSLYEAMIRLHGGVVVPVPPQEDLGFDVEGLIDAMDRTQAPLTIVTTPNNPTGLALTRPEVERLLEAAPGILVIDEAYVEFNPHGSVVDLIMDHPNLIVMRTLSKAFGLAGLRVGYLVGHPRLVGEIMKARLPFMVDRIAEATALSLLRNKQVVQERVEDMLRWTRELTEALASMPGVEVVPSSTNFVIFRAGVDAVQLMQRLADDGVLVRNMGGYPELRGYLRVTAGTEAENRVFLDAFNKAISELTGVPAN